MDQLNDLKNSKEIFSYVPKYIDTELPASKAQSHELYLFGVVKRKTNIILPIHFRYHLPDDTKYF